MKYVSKKLATGQIFSKDFFFLNVPLLFPDRGTLYIHRSLLNEILDYFDVVNGFSRRRKPVDIKCKSFIAYMWMTRKWISPIPNIRISVCLTDTLINSGIRVNWVSPYDKTACA